MMRIIVILLSATLLTTLPYLLYHIGGESMTYEEYLRCFADQFWRGTLYPRWCFDTNATLGAPIFLFYFPLGYWLGSLLYPLTWLGLDLTPLYAILILLVTFAAAVTCYLWLKTIFPRIPALAGTAMYLIVPYHAELLYFRSAYAELVGYALLPLLFLQTRNALAGDRRAWLWTAILFALSILAHATGGFIAAIGITLYALLTAPRRLLALAASLLAGAGLSAFYWLPAAYYKRFIISGDRLPKAAPVVNGYPDFLHMTADPYLGAVMPRTYLAAIVFCVAFVGLSAMFLAAGRPSRSAPWHREVRNWLLIALVAFLLYLPLLKPAWDALPPLQAIFFPWRMQLLWAPAAAMLAAGIVHARILRARRWHGDAFAIALLFCLAGLSMLRIIPPDQDVAAYRTLKLMNQPINQPVWVDNRDNTAPEIYKYLGQGTRIESATATQWRIDQWGPDRIRIHAAAPAADTLILHHRYFPTWQLLSPAGATLAPHAPQGFMAVTLPPGEREIVIAHGIGGGAPWLRAVAWFSLLGWCACIALCWKWYTLRRTHT